MHELAERLKTLPHCKVVHDPAPKETELELAASMIRFKSNRNLQLTQVLEKAQSAGFKVYEPTPGHFQFVPPKTERNDSQTLTIRLEGPFPRNKLAGHEFIVFVKHPPETEGEISPELRNRVVNFFHLISSNKRITPSKTGEKD